MTDIQTVTTSDWSFWTPLSKSVSEDSDGRRWIKGIASTEDKDLQGEIVQQGGIDFSYFLEHGYFNNDHKPGFANKVGQPTKCKHTKDGLYVEGYLWKKGVHQVADDIWELIQALKASSSDRQVGMSIQGKTRKRAGNVILGCWVQDIAITPAPINYKTWVDIIKSLSGCSWCVHKGSDVCVGCHACDKALATGHGNPSLTGGTSGEALRVESLDSEEKDQLFGNSKKKDERRLSKSDVTELICDQLGYSYPTSALFAELVFKMHELRSE